jgi:hypothetical protein
LLTELFKAGMGFEILTCLIHLVRRDTVRAFPPLNGRLPDEIGSVFMKLTVRAFAGDHLFADLSAAHAFHGTEFIKDLDSLSFDGYGHWGSPGCIVSAIDTTYTRKIYSKAFLNDFGHAPPHHLRKTTRLTNMSNLAYS